MPLRAIARALDMSVRTVRKYARVETAEALIAPNRTRGYRPLDAFKPHLQARYGDGITVTATLFAEITARGYRGSLRTVREFLAHPRRHATTSDDSDNATDHRLDHAPGRGSRRQTAGEASSSPG